MPKYVAVATQVREVWLIGRANLDYWKERLATEKLVPLEVAGAAQIIISGTDARFKGLRFRELSVSVAASFAAGGRMHDGIFLVQAYNSSRFFALVERMWFSTPYVHGVIRVASGSSPSLQLRSGQVLFRAEMSGAPVRQPLSNGDNPWEGPLYLPGNRRHPGPGKVFFARLNGVFRTYQFLPGTDTVHLEPSKDHPVWSWLVESGFQGAEWLVREGATHARSATFARDVLAAPSWSVG